MLLLARTTAADQVEKRTEGLSTFIVDMKQALDAGTMTIRPIRTLMNHATTEVFLDGVELPADALVGEEGKGFRYILDGMNAERILIAAECIGDGRWFVEKASALRVRAGRLRPADRREPGRPVPDRAGARRDRGGRPDALQGRLAVRAGTAVRRRRRTWRSCSPRRRRGRRRTRASTPTAASASREEYDVERKFRETRLYTVAPVSNNLVLAFLGQHVLGMPRSY